MNLPELKKDFYKRLGPSDRFLYFTSNGLLCTLLGHSEIDGTPFISCSLSMGIKMLARRLGGNMVNIQNISNNQAIAYNYGENAIQYTGVSKNIIELIKRLEEKKINGAEILFECSIPEFLPSTEALFMTLTQSILKISDIEASPLEAASLAAGGENITPYLGIAYSRKGYCTLLSSGAPRNLPLPLSGYKVLTAHCTEKDHSRSKEINYAFEHISRLYPHIGTIADITPEMIQSAVSNIKSKTAAGYIYHLANENERILSAAKALKQCNIRALFTQMNLSQQSMERFWDLGNEHIFLARCCKGIDGVEAARCWKNGIVVIARDEKIDYAINMIKSEFENRIGYQPTFCVSEVF